MADRCPLFYISHTERYDTMTELTTPQRDLLTSLVCGTEQPLKGLPRVNATRVLHKWGLITALGEPTEKGKMLVQTWQAFNAPESPIEPRTAKKGKRATPAPEIAKQVPMPAPIAYKPPAPRQERKEYEPNEPFQRIVDEKQKTIGYLITKEGLSHALNTKGVLVNRGINHKTAEKRYRQLTNR